MRKFKLILVIGLLYGICLPVVNAKLVFAPFSKTPHKTQDLSDASWYNFTWTLIIHSVPSDPNSPSTEYPMQIKTAYVHNNTHLMIYNQIMDLTNDSQEWIDYPRNLRIDYQDKSKGDFLTYSFDANKDGDPNSVGDDMKGYVLPFYPFDGAWTPYKISDLDLQGQNDVYGYAKWIEGTGYEVTLILPINSGDKKGQDINIQPGDILYCVFFYNDDSIDWNAYYPRGFDLDILTESESTPPILEIDELEISGYTVKLDGYTGPQSSGTEISRILWDWGDGLKQTHSFPVSHTYEKVGNYTIKVTSVLNNTIKKTKKVPIRIEPRSVWDSVNIELTIRERRIDIGSFPEFTFKSSYNYDSEPFIGQINIDVPEIIEPSEYVFTVSGIHDPKYGVTNFTLNEVTCIFDRIKITDGGVSKTTANIGKSVTVWYKVEYEFDSQVFDDSSGVVFINGVPMEWSSSKNRWEKHYSSNEEGFYTYEITEIDDKQYGLTTIKDDVGTVTVEWRQQVIPGFPVFAISLGILVWMIIAHARADRLNN